MPSSMSTRAPRRCTATSIVIDGHNDVTSAIMLAAVAENGGVVMINFSTM